MHRYMTGGGSGLYACALAAMPALVLGTPASAEPGDPAAAIVHADASGIEIDRGRLDELAGAFVVGDVHLSGERTVSLELERFDVVGPNTRFVVGRDRRPLDFDPSSVHLFRGEVAGQPASRVILAVSDHGALGTVDLGGERYALSPVAGRDGLVLEARRGDAGRAPLLPGVPLCGAAPPPAGAPAVPPGGAGAPAAPAGDAIAPPTTRVIELAVETDFDYFSLFDDADAAAAYVVAVYAGVSDIYLRDASARIELTFVRLWQDPDDLFNGPSPLVEFRIFWNESMGDVPRDVAQFFSGRRDFPYGGAAYLGSLCGAGGYSVVGYALGFMPEDFRLPDIFNYDVHVLAHELGHNCNARHTHDYMIDECDDLDTPPQRGTIMSYCSQTVSGGNANTDVRFHTFVQAEMRAYLEGAECVHADCNGNGVPDDQDIAFGGISDVNGNGVPDECEDCNGNGVLDSDEIAAGTSTDLDANGRPDECDPDCNGNGIPDALEIVLGMSSDVYGDGIPDACQADCDGNGIADYNDIQSDMSLDVDRNARLDGCEDCDGDGVPDLDALAGAHNVWIASLAGRSIGEFHAVTGVRTGTSVAGRVLNAQDLVIDDAGRIFVSSSGDDRVVEFDRSGRHVRDFVAAGGGGLSYPTGMVFGPGGNLFVASRNTNSVLEFDGSTGDFVRSFVTSQSGDLAKPFGVAFGPNGNFFVTSSDDQVLEFDGGTGAFVGVFVSRLDNGGLNDPRGIAFKPDGNLLVNSLRTDSVLEYDGLSGAFVRKFNKGGTDVALTLDRPSGIRIGPDGVVYVSRSGVGGDPGGPSGGYGEHDEHDEHASREILLHVNSTRLYAFDLESGNFLRSFVLGNDTGLWEPTGFDFYPGASVDCNRNLRPDACDISSGASADVNVNGVPDECECLADLSGDAVIGFDDLLALLAAWGPCDACPEDLDGDGTVGFSDVTTVLSTWGPCPSS